jgi:hypothetical protein
VRRQLEDRVDLHQLDAGGAVEALGTDAVDDVAPSRRPIRSVRVGLGDQVVVLVDEAVVDAPRIDTDRRHVTSSLQAALHLAEEPAHLPATVDRSVRGAVHDLDLEGVQVDARHARRRGAEVDGSDDRQRPVATAPRPRSASFASR